MSKELEVNWITTQKEVGKILIKTLDLDNYYVFTDNETYHTFGVDSEVAISCFPTIPMLMTRYIKQALTPPTAEEIEVLLSIELNCNISFYQSDFDGTLAFSNAHPNQNLIGAHFIIRTTRGKFKSNVELPNWLVTKITKYFTLQEGGK